MSDQENAGSIPARSPRFGKTGGRFDSGACLRETNGAAGPAVKGVRGIGSGGFDHAGMPEASAQAGDPVILADGRHVILSTSPAHELPGWYADVRPVVFAPNAPILAPGLRR